MVSLRKILDSFVVPDPQFDDLLSEIDRATKETVERAQRLDEALCINCGPNKLKLRQLSVRLKHVGAKRRLRGASA